MQKIKEILKKHKTKVTHVQLYRFMLNPNHMGGGDNLSHANLVKSASFLTIISLLT